MQEKTISDPTSSFQNKTDELLHDKSTTSAKDQLREELADATLLHQLSIELIQEDGISSLYKKIVEAALTIMRSQYATMQMLFPDTDHGGIGKLRLLASCNFTPEAEQFWEWVYQHTGSSCGAALRAQSRAIIPNFAQDEFMKTAPTLPVFLNAGIYAVQSTPLYSRSGKLLGMISTHWNYPYMPPERHLHLLDILARQAADLIERTQTNEYVRHSEERLRALTLATNDVIYRLSADCGEMYELEGTALIPEAGQHIANWLQNRIDPQDQEGVLQVINEAIEKKALFQYEHRRTDADGTVRWKFSRAIPIVARDGAISEWFGAETDITEKKSFVTRLEQLVEERTKELHRSNEDLHQFAHVASHDLREPVRKIETYGLRLYHLLGNDHVNEAKTYTMKILESAKRMSAMINGVLTYSSMNAARQDVETINLNEIITGIQSDLEVLISQKDALIQSDELPAIEGMPVLIYQLFYNLINNSLKFSLVSPRPVIRLTAECTRVDDVDHVRISLFDNGIGFDPEDSLRIFEPFTRLNSRSRFDGTGLGLSLVKKIVERHHGRILASGRKNEGAAFIITLPFVQPRLAPGLPK